MPLVHRHKLVNSFIQPSLRDLGNSRWLSPAFQTPGFCRWSLRDGQAPQMSTLQRRVTCPPPAWAECPHPHRQANKLEMRRYHRNRRSSCSMSKPAYPANSSLQAVEPLSIQICLRPRPIGQSRPEIGILSGGRTAQEQVDHPILIAIQTLPGCCHGHRHTLWINGRDALSGYVNLEVLEVQERFRAG